MLKQYRINEFAERAGVTVRTLHHYDRIGLLKPGYRSAAGYRLYTDNDLLRLEQIVVLKFIGMSLKDIRRLLDEDRSALPEMLERQQHLLRQKRGQIDSAIQLIGAAQRALQAAGAPDWSLFGKVIKDITMNNETDWMNRYYSEEARAKIEARKHLWSPELQERVARQWNELFRDIEASLDEDPASPKAQELLARWRGLINEFTGGDPEIQAGLNKMYADQANWPEEQRQRNPVRPEIQRFIEKAMKASSSSTQKS